MKTESGKFMSLCKIAFDFSGLRYGQTVGFSNPPHTVGEVLSSIGVAQSRGIGSQNDRVDAFGRIIDSGLANTSPAGNALRLLGGGILGRAITGAFTNNSFAKGVGTGIGALSALNRW